MLDLHLDARPGRACGPGSRQRCGRRCRPGGCAAGTRLPSSRTLAADLGVARNTVAEAYGQLVAEGWLTARHGSGTRVAERGAARPGRRRAAAAARDRGPALRPAAGLARPVRVPARGVAARPARALAAAPAEAFGYGDPRGPAELRAALADYLARARGVRADPDRIVICSGVHPGVGAAVPGARGRAARRAVAVEAYGHRQHREHRRRGRAARARRSPVDERGAVAGACRRRRTRSLLTPAHQFPLGMPLAPDRRPAVAVGRATPAGW